ncbi:MAG: Dabb family protein [Pseudomonadota bacterium]
MILHCVFCTFKNGVSAETQADIFNALKDFSQSLDGALAFDHGPNRDFEDKSASYQSGFVIRFADKAALQAYAVHPTHQALGAQLCALCVGGADGVIVFDLEV